MTITRLRAGFAITFAGLAATLALLPPLAGGQAATAATCSEPVLKNLPARGEEGQLVRFRLADMTPGSEYLVRVSGRERKTGTATEDRVSRRFRMPNLGQDRQRVFVEVVIDNEACENAPWKFAEKITYEPAPEPAPAPPKAQPAPTPTPQPTPSPPAPSPPPAPSITNTPKPKAQPPVPSPSVNPAVPKTNLPTAPSEPPKDGRAWVTPTDPWQKGKEATPKVDASLLSRTDLPSDPANSTAALLGLGGAFLVLAGIVAMSWNRFRRYDDARLTEYLNPEGKLPTHLDPKAKDMGGKKIDQEEAEKKAALPVPWRRKKAATAAAAAAAAPNAKRRAAGGKGRGLLADLSDEELEKMTEEEKEALKAERKKERKRARKQSRRAVLPTFDPTQQGATVEHGPKKDPDKEAKKAEKRRLFRRGSDAPAPDAAKPEAPQAPEAPKQPEAPKRPEPAAPVAEGNGKPPAQAVPPITAPQHANGGVPHTPSPPAKAPNGRPLNRYSYRKEVESELQRILEDAGLHAEVEGILADAKAEAERQGVPIDSELMLRALSDETNGAAKLSDSARDELQSRFKRIAAEERGEQKPSPGS